MHSTSRGSWIARLFGWRRGRGAGTIDPLTRLAIKHGTDKWGPHFYTPIYHELFSPLRGKPVRLLEIGTGGYGHVKAGGSSLAMWAEYFPNGRFVGIDIAEKRLDLDPRIQLRRGSQVDPAFLTSLCDEFGPFDIVIDDGSHIPEHVVASFNILFDRLSDGALYAIEDAQTAYWPNFGGSPDGGATMRLMNSILENLNHAEIKVAQPDRQTADVFKSIRSFRAYHNLFIIEKGDNTEPSNYSYSFDNAHAARALHTIERELASSPTPAGYAGLVNLYVTAGDLATASAVVRGALEKWPDHSDLLRSAYQAAVKSGDESWQEECLRRLHVLKQQATAQQP